ncbi:Phosphatidylinositol N-acetylglucosaminyltransferase GPI3 subunit [Babesia sp. Xinjiang]|uniref:Phosphatidylinositol N-acetylglucosaminyltransferase GPI3 subunit n=1 Tax=Babesia sp. Xinjiang TaxID=462227 RepID=UPI000A248661|nr:Phosphatidylinositol N-acetylglucosaminyltransferase GPI3 subunit [Babesia sp. Xinjiang]ORM40221.1 Phosphatidylinositol N-acetylglucosaminyltransferase GPI3 subunit [Babesia sp. Xinjiang]
MDQDAQVTSGYATLMDCSICHAEMRTESISTVRGHNDEVGQCSCSTSSTSRSSPAPCDTLLTKPFGYKNHCNAIAWYPADDHIFLSAGDSMINVWDLNIVDIAYTFNVRLSAVKHIAVGQTKGTNPVIVVGLACGSISTCDMRSSATFNYPNNSTRGEVTALYCTPHNEHLVVAGYEDTTVCIWDLRRYNRPVALLGSKAEIAPWSVVNGCHISYGDGSKSATEIPFLHSQDFENEEDIWSYVMQESSSSGPSRPNSTSAAKSSLSARKKQSTPAASNPLFDPKMFTVPTLQLDRPPPKSRRNKSTISVTDILMSDSSGAGDSVSSRQSVGRVPKRDPKSRAGSKLLAKYVAAYKRYRANSTLEDIGTLPGERAASVGRSPARRPMTLSERKALENKSHGMPTAFDCTLDGNTLFVARHKGHVEKYDGRNYRYIRHFDIAALTQPYHTGEPPSYAQRMYLMARDAGNWLLFNAGDKLAVIDSSRGTLGSIIGMRWENHEMLVDESVPSTMDSTVPRQKYVTDFTALRGRRDIYALNERGELFVVHPVGSIMSNALTYSHRNGSEAPVSEGMCKPSDNPEPLEPIVDLKHRRKRRLTILMVSEFFYPDVGGIETHICALSTKLIEMGHCVVVVTRHFGERRGVRYMSNGMKVYHIPTVYLVKPCGLPVFITTFLLARNILIREQVDIVHFHQTSSRYGSEFAHTAYMLGLKSVFTDHSLFSFVDIGPITLTNYLRSQSSIIDHTICVSNTHKENLVLRTQMDPTKISVIGNAIESESFKPRLTDRNDGKIVIVVISRLTEKKGAHLLNDVIPLVCKRYENVNFIIGGDGPLYSNIAERIDKLYLHKRVTLLGAVPTYKVNDVLIRGDIFLNTSKSESFCIAILEAVSSGLLCVSTNVGGVYEILPRDMVLLANYSAESVANRIEDAIERLPTIDRQGFHDRIANMYSWRKVAEQVLEIYDKVLCQPSISPFELIYHYWETKSIFRKLHDTCLFTLIGASLILVVTLLYIEWWIAELIYPRDEIDIAPKWSRHGDCASGVKRSGGTTLNTDKRSKRRLSRKTDDETTMF